MTVEAQRPTGTPGTAPRGPAGPHPEPKGPKSPGPMQPPTPRPAPKPSKALAEELDTLHLMARSMRVLATRGLSGADPAGRMRLSFALDLTLRTIADLQSPARRDLSPIGAGVATQGGPVPNSGREGKVAVSGRSTASSRPVQPPAGQKPPLPGGDFLLPELRGLPSFEALLNP